ncbi:MAG: Rpn family recombination-promoting nuclease/putative transposase, partial [Fibrobacter sp.]|nr:Rpn family recombination-promoting nuclease/putative transposase [Fibrobacter sp.]
MNKTQYAEMLKDISETHKNGGDVSACIAKYNERYKYVYVYNDNIFKILFGNPENESITVDFLNAVLKLDGGDCIERVSFVNPALPEAIGKSITSDVVALDQRQERIVLEVQHVEHESYNSRLVLYAAKHTIASRVKGDDYRLRNLNLISLQMFDGFPESRNYRHCIRLKNQDNEVFYEKETITLVEIPKFIKRKYEKDSSRLALWLRVFDGLNRECPVDVPKGSQYALLQ